MSVLVVVAHPVRESLTVKLALRFQEGIGRAGITTSSIDLYAQGFDPVLAASEMEQLAAGRVAPAVAQAHDALQAASGLALVYPVWWAAPPAILLGWIQRVLIEGFAYRYEDRARGLLALPAQLILNAGTQDRSLQAVYSEPLRSVLSYCGCGPVECHINWGIYPGNPVERSEAALVEAYAAGVRFGQRLSKTPEF